MARTIKTTLELGGESAYKKGLQSIDRALKAMSFELKEATAKFSENSASLKNVSGVSNVYKNQVEQQKIKVDSLKGAVESSTKSYNDALAKYEQMAKEHGENSVEALKAADSLAKAEKSMDDFKNKLSSAEKYLDSSKKAMEEFTKQNKNVLALAQTTDKLKSKITEFADKSDNVKKISSAFKDVQDAAKKISDKLTPVKNALEKVKTGTNSVKGAFELAAKKAAAIKEKLQPAINVCKNVAKAAAKITFKTAETGAKAVTTSVKAAAKALTAYTTAATGLATATFASIESTREYRNDLAKLEQGAKTSGNSFSEMKKELVNLTALTGESDSSIEALSNLMSAGFSDTQIKSAVESLSGAVIKFPDTLKIESLADSLQETIATGAGTGQFAELIERSGASLDDFNNGLANCSGEAERQQYALQWLAESGLAQVNAEYEKSHKALLDYEKAEQAVNEANSKIAQSAMPIAASFKKGYAGVLAAFADVLTGVDKTGAEFNAKISVFLSNIAGMAVQYLPVLLTAVNTIIQSVVTNLPMLLETILPPLISGFNLLITGLIDALPEFLPVLLDSFVMLFSSLIDSVNLVIEQLMPLLPDIITQISTALIENLPVLLDGALQLFLGLIQSLNQVVEQLMPMLPELITNLCDTLIEHIDEIINTGFDLLVGLIDGITECIPTLLEKLPEIIDKLVNTLTNSENLQKLIQSGIDLITALAEGLPKACFKIVAAIPEIVSAIWDTLKETDWKQLGIDLVRGIADGLVDGVDFIWDKICEMGNKIMDKVKSFFGIKSPSRLFKKEVGTYLAQGLGVGFVDEMDKVTKDMQNALPTSFDTMVNADISSFSNTKNHSSSSEKSNSGITVIIDKVEIHNDDDIEDTAYKLALKVRQAEMALGV
nr:MAG TPA: minor tail protein [Caudoviricetes sp.]